MQITCRNINHAFHLLVQGIDKGSTPTIETTSRQGKVIRVNEPVLLALTNPTERVLFNQARDANPFFHMYEAIWMLAGRNDLTPIEYYVKNFGQFSDDGKTLHGAYGYRWRNWFGYDQLEEIIENFREDPKSRRNVLQMWDGTRTSITSSRESGDLMTARHGGKDVPCNTECLFSLINGYLDMTVINRSNDLVLGLCGANIVHFSFLLEYMAAMIGCYVGHQYHFTINLHAYLKDFKSWRPNEWLADQSGTIWYETNSDVKQGIGAVSVEEMKFFTDMHDGESPVVLGDGDKLSDLFLRETAHPMLMAFHLHKEGDTQRAVKAMEHVKSSDWKKAGIEWLERRLKNKS